MRCTVNDAIDRYIREVLPLKSATTQPGDLFRLAYWREALGPKLIADVTPPDISDVRQTLLSNLTHGNKQRSNATVNRYMAVGRHVFKYAMREWRLIERSPFEYVGNLREAAGRTRFLSNEERKRFLAACKASSNPELYTLVTAALHTGMRQGELLNLEWRDIDFDEGLITVRDTKNGEVRYVPLSEPLAALLRPLRAMGYVFTGRRREHYRYAFELAVDTARIPDFRFHDLRHTCASYLAQNGASTIDLAEILGHKTLEMVKRYAHLGNDHKRKVLEKMASGLD